MAKKDAVAASANLLGATGLSGKAVTSITAHKHGDVLVIEIGFSGGSAFIKSSKGVVKVGGGTEWDTGSEIIS